MFKDPPFYRLSPPLKILALIMVMIITFLVVLAIGVAFSIPFFGSGILDEIALISDYSDLRTVRALKYFQIVNQLGVFVAPAILFVILTDDDFPGYLNLNRGLKRFSVFFGFIVIAVSLPFISWLLEVNENIHLPAFLSQVESWMRSSEDKAQQLTEAFLSTGSWGGFFVNLLMIAGLAAIGEELIFRGILVRLFKEWTHNVHLGVIIPSLLFSALHLQFYGFFGRFVLGVVLGYLFVWSGSLWVPIIVHFLNNAMAVIMSFLDQRGIISADLESFGSSANVLIIAGSLVLMIFTMSVIYLHEKKFFKKKTPAG
jgi:membrane protease YdiL (CAAX protease family)